MHSYDLYHIHIMSFSSYNGYKLNSHLTCFQRGFIAQLVEHRVWILLKPQNFFWAFFATALVASQLRGSLSLVFSCSIGYSLCSAYVWSVSHSHYLAFLCNCFSCFITARISFTIIWIVSWTKISTFLKLFLSFFLSVRIPPEPSRPKPKALSAAWCEGAGLLYPGG